MRSFPYFGAGALVVPVAVRGAAVFVTGAALVTGVAFVFTEANIAFVPIGVSFWNGLAAAAGAVTGAAAGAFLRAARARRTSESPE